MHIDDEWFCCCWRWINALKRIMHCVFIVCFEHVLHEFIQTNWGGALAQPGYTPDERIYLITGLRGPAASLNPVRSAERSATTPARPAHVFIYPPGGLGGREGPEAVWSLLVGVGHNDNARTGLDSKWRTTLHENSTTADGKILLNLEILVIR